MACWRFTGKIPKIPRKKKEARERTERSGYPRKATERHRQVLEYNVMVFDRRRYVCYGSNEQNASTRLLQLFGSSREHCRTQKGRHKEPTK